ncbi:MAG TPA: ABC transporter permease [Streptosporangiaceae bacterium]|nr:ABC transporter permease [Streptosporangiaceae bacterium]
MRAVTYLAAHDQRARWRDWAVLVLLVAVAGGAVLAAAGGASRTETAYPRFLAASHASGVVVAPTGSGPEAYFPGLPEYFSALARLPGVSELAPVVGLNLEPLGRGGQAARNALTLSPLDGRFGQLVDVPKVLAGRLPRADRTGEIAVDQRGAALMHVQVGSVLTMRANPPGPPATVGRSAAHPRLLRERVVGIVVTRGSVLPVTELDKVPVILASPALFHELGPRYVGFSGAFVILQRGTSLGELVRRGQSLTRQFPAAGELRLVADERTQVAAIQHAIRPEAIALALFALVLAITALLIVGQAATRLLATDSRDNRTLVALGMTRRQLMAAGLIKVGVAAAAGATAAAGAAVTASPLMPIGAARRAEPNPGFSADATVLAAGAAAIVVLLVARAAWPAWRLACANASAGGLPTPAPAPRSRLTAWLAAAGVPVTAAAGVRLALEPGRGRAAVPVRSALAGTVLSVLAVTAALTFGANLLHLVHTPPLYGQRWDAAIDVQFASPPMITPADARHRLGQLPGIAGWTFGHHGTVGIGGHVIPAIGLTAGQGPLLSPTLLEGRPPRTDGEIVLGTSTLRQIGRHVGQSVTVTVNRRQLPARIVGRAVFPNFGQGGFTPTDLGRGALTTAGLLRDEAAPPGFELVLLSFTPGPRRAANIAGFQRSMTGFCQNVQQSTCVVIGQRPNGVTNYTSIDRTPAVLAVLLAAVGIAVLGQFIVLSGRRRRRDFAILKALGMLRRQVSAITAWQVSTVTVIALVAGLPLGVAAGRWSWMLFCRGLGIPPLALTPLWPVLVLVPAVIVIANVVAFWPARATARLRPADVLRTE